MTKEKAATLKEVMKYFNETSTKQFTEEWKQLSPEVKDWMKAEIGSIINSID